MFLKHEGDDALFLGSTNIFNGNFQRQLMTEQQGKRIKNWNELE